MSLPPAVTDRLARLAPDQRAAATAPPGPVLCVAPAGSGKTTTLVARVAWLVATGADPGSICGITFNRRAAEELQVRVAAALEPLGLGPDAVRIKTFHALGREILRDAGEPVEPLLDRTAVLRELAPDISGSTLRRLDDGFSRLKLDLGVTAADVARDPSPGPIAAAFLAYEQALDERGGLDFDDLVARALRRLEADAPLLRRWRAATSHLLVDEAQDVDRSQLRLALLLAAPANRIFLVGDDDQTIYGWRLADVRRVLGLAAELPGLRRVDLETNYRCPRPVVERAVRLVEGNRERFAKRIRAGPAAAGRLVLAPDAAEEAERVRHVVATWPRDDSSRAILARTNRELLPAAAVALELGIPFRAARLPLPLENERVPALLDACDTIADAPLLVRLGRLRPGRAGEVHVDLGRGVHGCHEHREEGRDPAVEVERAVDDGALDPPDADGLPVDALVAALLGWAVPHRDLESFRAAVLAGRERLAALRRDDARLTLATAHATKGLEFDDVAVIGLDAGRFPSARSLRDAADPARTLEEERRLAYVAWTRARRSLTLVYDPAAPSPFLLEAFDADELRLEARGPPRRAAAATRAAGSRLGGHPRGLMHRYASGE
ncbi:MAG TPA: ATP-dependent helicase [Candidatus Limnocylindrales bacterium]